MSESERNESSDGADQLAKLLGEIASGGRVMTDDGRDLAAVLLGRRGGLKGGPARAASMTAERRSEVARLAAKKRWAREGNDNE